MYFSPLMNYMVRFFWPSFWPLSSLSSFSLLELPINFFFFLLFQPLHINVGQNGVYISESTLNSIHYWNFSQTSTELKRVIFPNNTHTATNPLFATSPSVKLSIHPITKCLIVIDDTGRLFQVSDAASPQFAAGTTTTTTLPTVSSSTTSNLKQGAVSAQVPKSTNAASSSFSSSAAAAAANSLPKSTGVLSASQQASSSQVPEKVDTVQHVHPIVTLISHQVILPSMTSLATEYYSLMNAFAQIPPTFKHIKHALLIPHRDFLFMCLPVVMMNEYNHNQTINHDRLHTNSTDAQINPSGEIDESDLVGDDEEDVADSEHETQSISQHLLLLWHHQLLLLNGRNFIMFI